MGVAAGGSSGEGPNATAGGLAADGNAAPTKIRHLVVLASVAILGGIALVIARR